MSDKDIVLFAVENEKGERQVMPGINLPQAVLSYNSPKPNPGTKPSAPKLEDEGQEYVFWGTNDLLGTDFRKKVEKVPLAGVTIRKKTQLMYGNGLVYYLKEDLKAGNKVKRHYEEKIEDWLDRNKIRTKWLPSQIQDYSLFLQCWGEFILSKDRKSITGIKSLGAEFCRKDLLSENLFYSFYFPTSNANEQNWVKMPLIPEYDLEGYFEKNKSHKFGYHTYYPTSGMLHYPTAPWISLAREYGWLDTSAAVPEIISSMQRNQIMIKYQINIPYSYFTTRYPNWTDYTDVKKKEIMDKKVSDLNDLLSDTKNKYKSIATIFMDSEVMSDKGGLIEIIPIDDKTKNDAWVPSSNASDAQIVQGLEVHPSQIGLAPEGGKMGAGSGSDQRESYNTSITLNTIDQLIILEQLNMVSNFNEWGVIFAIDHTHHTTTNNQESGMAPSEQSIEIKPADNG